VYRLPCDAVGPQTTKQIVVARVALNHIVAGIAIKGIIPPSP
jgi:hypothetical protein